MDMKLDFERFLRDVDIGDESEFVDFGNVKGNHCCVGEKHGVVSDLCVGIEEENRLMKKRKKERYEDLLDWVKLVAKNPCDPDIGAVPESSKWKAYGGDRFWKQVLMVKKAMRFKVYGDLMATQPICKKKQKVHPDIYNDRSMKSHTRCSQRLVSIEENCSITLPKKAQVLDHVKSSCPGSDKEEKDSLWSINYRKKRIPLGRFFQAEVPQWTGKAQESETKWLGTRIWPPEATETRTTLIEREPIGKGRRGSCGCEVMNSIECVRFHVSEKKTRLKLELGSAFAKWRFNMMGEEVALKWTKNEEKQFAHIIKSNPESSGRYFWDVLMTHFKNKTTPVLVSYYFSVYLLRRRAHQNRVDPSNVNSDDDELEKVGQQINKSSNMPFKVNATF